jgi:gliding motility-associated-like protein
LEHEHEYQEEDIYYAVVVGNLFGCLASDTILVNAYGVSSIGCLQGLDNCGWYEIPNIVTPNGDHYNDVFWVPNVHLKELEVHIFNRWGSEVGNIVTPNHYWDVPLETWDPADVESGVYFYTINALGKDGKTYLRDGSFQVIK